MGVRTVRHHDVADFPRIGTRLHGIDAIGEIGRTHPGKVAIGLVQAGICKVVVGAVDAAETERHGVLL
jgi:hypothetical protein